MTLLDIVWSIFIGSLFVGYLIVLFRTIEDLFRDRGLGGLAKAVWVLALLVLPLLTVLVYLVVRGDGMGDRAAERALGAKVVQRSAVQEISEAKQLLDGGALSRSEFERVKAQAFNPVV